MIKSNTSPDLKKTLEDTSYIEWLQNPISVGSIYIKPTEEKKTCCDHITRYFYWYLCCGYCR